jgi:hypothetical protein
MEVSSRARAVSPFMQPFLAVLRGGFFLTEKATLRPGFPALFNRP